jgi:hypothetical protein
MQARPFLSAAFAASVLFAPLSVAYADEHGAADPKAPSAEPAHAAEPGHGEDKKHEEGKEHGEGKGHEGKGHEEHEEHHRFVTGVNAIALGAIAHGHAIGEYGGGGFFEVVAIPGWLEFELGAHYLRTAEKTNVVPIDLLVKKPFHPLPWLNPYVGLGPTFIPAFGNGEKSFHAGLATEAGAYFWVSHRVGISAEINYNLVSESGLVQEVAGLSGVVVGF